MVLRARRTITANINPLKLTSAFTGDIPLLGFVLLMFRAVNLRAYRLYRAESKSITRREALRVFPHLNPTRGRHVVSVSATHRMTKLTLRTRSLYHRRDLK